MLPDDDLTEQQRADAKRLYQKLKDVVLDDPNDSTMIALTALLNVAVSFAKHHNVPPFVLMAGLAEIMGPSLVDILPNKGGDA
jgi:hypothetical protein